MYGSVALILLSPVCIVCVVQQALCILLFVCFSIIFYFSSTGPAATQSLCTKTNLFLAHSVGMDVIILLVVCDLCGRLLASSISQQSFVNIVAKQKNRLTQTKYDKGKNSRNTWNTKCYLYMNKLFLKLYVSKRNRLHQLTSHYFRCWPHV